MIKAIIFDFDGVLVDSEKHWTRLKLKTLKLLNIKKKHPKIVFKKFIGMQSEVFFKKILGVNLYKVHKNKIIAKYKKLKINYKFCTTLNPHVKKILSHIKIEKAIVSNNDRTIITKHLKYHKINKFFINKNIISYKDLGASKPSPLGYKLILRILKCNKNEVLVIEDSLSGIKAAKAAGIVNILQYKKKSDLTFKKIIRRIS